MAGGAGGGPRGREAGGPALSAGQALSALALSALPTVPAVPAEWAGDSGPAVSRPAPWHQERRHPTPGRSQFSTQVTYVACLMINATGR